MFELASWLVFFVFKLTKREHLIFKRCSRLSFPIIPNGTISIPSPIIGTRVAPCSIGVSDDSCTAWHSSSLQNDEKPSLSRSFPSYGMYRVHSDMLYLRLKCKSFLYHWGATLKTHIQPLRYYCNYMYMYSINHVNYFGKQCEHLSQSFETNVVQRVCISSLLTSLYGQSIRGLHCRSYVQFKSSSLCLNMIEDHSHCTSTPVIQGRTSSWDWGALLNRIINCCASDNCNQSHVGQYRIHNTPGRPQRFKT